MSQQLQFPVFQLGKRTDCQPSWFVYDECNPQLKNESKVPVRFFWECSLLFTLYIRAHAFLRLFSKAHFCGQACLYQLSYFLGSQTHDYLMKHRSSSFSFLYPAPVTFLSEAFKKKSAVTVAERKFNFWVGNWRIIHEQISSKWYDLLNFGLWFIFMYSCYCYKVVPASIRSWMRSF